MILYSKDIRQSLDSWLQDNTYDKIFLLGDENTIKYCSHFIADLIPKENTISIPSGEKTKTIHGASTIWSELAAKGAGRKSLLVNLGGGMITDMGGFCASVYQRGIDFVHIPTTLLAMTDAAIGGKTGIDFQDLKNYIGTFQLPKAIFIYPYFLKTLPKEELLNGWAEVLKHGIIQGLPLWNLVHNSPLPADDLAWNTLIKLNIDLKNKIVSEDPIEKGIRKTLNLGHTVGHALETLRLREDLTIKHGYCVAFGLIIEAMIAKELNLMDGIICTEIIQSINKIFTPISISESEIPAIIDIIDSDKKNQAGSIRMVLPRAIGKIDFDVIVSEEIIHKSLFNYIHNEA